MSIQAGSYGFVLSLSSGLDLSTATAVNLILQAPGGAPVVKPIPLPAGMVNGPAGQIAYQVGALDFPAPGVYLVQVQDASPGRSLFSRVAQLVVEENLS